MVQSPDAEGSAATFVDRSAAAKTPGRAFLVQVSAPAGIDDILAISSARNQRSLGRYALHGNATAAKPSLLIIDLQIICHVNANGITTPLQRQSNASEMPRRQFLQTLVQMLRAARKARCE